MSLKRNVFVIVFLIVNTIGFSQNYKKQLTSDFNRYINLIIDMNFEKAMDYTHPDIFKIVPKSQLVAIMKQALSNPMIEFSIKEPKILSINDAKKINTQYYATLSYSSIMKIKFKITEKETESEKEMRISRIQQTLENNESFKEVTYDPKTDFFNVLVIQKCFAISKNGQTNWKFLVAEKKQANILKKILPAELTKNL